MSLINYLSISNEGLTFSKVGKTKVIEFEDKKDNPIYLSIIILNKLDKNSTILASFFGTGVNDNTDTLLRYLTDELNKIKETMKTIEANFKKQGEERDIKYKELPGLLNNNPDWSNKYKEDKEILSKAIMYSKKLKEPKIGAIISEFDKIVDKVNTLLKSNIKIINK